MIIGVDVDGVCADMVGDLGLVPEDVREYDFSHMAQVKRTIIRTKFADWGFWRHLSELPGARDGVEQLKENHEVVFITAPYYKYKHWVHARYAWLWDFAGLDSDIIVTDQKHLVDVDVFIDDKLENLVMMQTHKPDCRTIGFGDYGYNQAWDGERVSSWGELLEVLK